MNYDEFREKVKNYPVFRSNIFNHLTDDVTTLKSQVSHWVQKGYVHQVKRGLYTLRDADQGVGFSRFFLANQLYTPSYISLESALSYYHIIPEAVSSVTSVTSRKTKRFANHYGDFIYHHIKLASYGDYISQTDEFNNHFLIASKERALLDYLYLKTRGLKKIDEDIFTASFRWQNLEKVDIVKILELVKHYNQKKLIILTKYLIREIKKNA